MPRILIEYLRMHLLCFAKSTGEAPSTRQRVMGLMDVARSRGWKTTLVFTPAYPSWNFLPSRFLRIFRYIWTLLRADFHTVVLLQRTIRNPEFLFLLKIFRPKLKYVIADFDDAVWLHSPKDAEFLIHTADELWCGSRVIVDYGRSKNANVVFVPTTIDTHRFDKPHADESVPVIGWVGDELSHLPNLLFFADILSKIRSTLPKFRLRLIGIERHRSELEQAFTFLGTDIDIRGRMEPAVIPEHVSHFSIGIMPLVDNEFNRGKSALKLVEYLAAGVPIVASDVGENRYVVSDPEHGYLARNPMEWQKTLSTLLGNPALRMQLGSQGQAFVREHYDRSEVYGRHLERLATLLTP